MTASDLLFLVFAASTCATAVAVVVSQNVVRMAFWLILSLGSTAGLFFLLNADFVGAAQLLVYVGGTLVLLIFGVMLTASGPFISIKTSPGDGFLAGIVGFALLGLLLSSACSVGWDRLPSAQDPSQPLGSGYNVAGEGNTTRALGFSFLGLRPDRDLRAGSAGQHGAPAGASVGYLLPFEIASVHLLVVLIGAAYLARTKRRKELVGGQSVPVKSAL